MRQIVINSPRVRKYQPTEKQINDAGFKKGVILTTDLLGELKKERRLTGTFVYFAHTGNLYAHSKGYQPLLIYSKGKFLNFNHQTKLF